MYTVLTHILKVTGACYWGTIVNWLLFHPTVGRHRQKQTAKEKMKLFFTDILVFISLKY